MITPTRVKELLAVDVDWAFTEIRQEYLFYASYNRHVNDLLQELEVVACDGEVLKIAYTLAGILYN